MTIPYIDMSQIHTYMPLNHTDMHYFPLWECILHFVRYTYTGRETPPPCGSLGYEGVTGISTGGEGRSSLIPTYNKYLPASMWP